MFGSEEVPGNFNVDPRSGVPLYSQLIDQVKRSIAVGALRPGERLPTVKQLAVDLTINPNTVARAYRDLERDGVIETSPARSSVTAIRLKREEPLPTSPRSPLKPPSAMLVRSASSGTISKRSSCD